MDFIKKAVAANCRLDGRTLDAQPSLKIEPNVSAVSHGSCRVTLDDTVVITTVTFGVTAPTKTAPDEGTVELTLGTPFTLEDTEISQSDEEFMEKQLEMMTLQAAPFEKRLLCILPSQFVWSLKIHSTVLQSGGTPLDAISIAMVVALRTASVPNLDVIVRDEMNVSKQGGNVRLKVAEGHNIDVNKLTSKLPVCVTLSHISGLNVWGATKEEEECSEGSLSVAITSEGKCVALRTSGTCFDTSVFGELMNRAREIATVYHQKAEQAILQGGTNQPE